MEPLAIWIIIQLSLVTNQNPVSNINAVQLLNEKIIETNIAVLSPQWSSDDETLLLSGAGYKGIYLYSFSDEKLTQLTNLFGSGYRPAWSSDEKSIYFRYKDQFVKNNQYETHNVDLEGRKNTLKKNIDPFTLFTEVDTDKSNDISILYNRQTLQVEGRFKNSKETWVITSGNGAYYHPVLSPNRSLLLAHSNSKMYVFATDGSGLIAEIGRGLGNSWSPDSKHILFTIEESIDGHIIDNAELYYTDLSADRIQLTATKDRIECWPDWSSDGKRIAYSDKSSGNLIIADIVIK